MRKSLLRARGLRGGVHRGQTERTPEAVTKPFGLSGGFEQLLNRLAIETLPALSRQLQAHSEQVASCARAGATQTRQTEGQPEATRAASPETERRRLELQRQPRQALLVAVQVSDQCQGLAVRTDHHVLAVVQDEIRAAEARTCVSRPPARDRRSLEQRDLTAGFAQPSGQGQACPPGAHDGDGSHGSGGRWRSQVSQASNSLRIGVSEVRRSRTRKPSASISRNRRE